MFNSSQARETRAAEERRVQADALEAYLDGMSQLLIDNTGPLHETEPNDSRRVLARARTLSALGRLNGHLKGNVVQFLFESNLITKEHVVLDLTNADLGDAILAGRITLPRISLAKVYLNEAILLAADMREANLYNTNLRNAMLIGTNLSGADLTNAYLPGALFSNANLCGAKLSDADLRGADLSGADLSKAFLAFSNLFEAKITSEQLSTVATFGGATLPHGQVHNDWLSEKMGSKGWLSEKMNRLRRGDEDKMGRREDRQDS